MTRTWSTQFHCAADNNQKLNARNRVLLSSDRGKGGKSLRACVDAASSSRATWRAIVCASAHQRVTVGIRNEDLHRDKSRPGSVLDSINAQRLHQFQQVGTVQPERFGCGRAIALRAPERVDDERSSMAVHRFVEWLRFR